MILSWLTNDELRVFAIVWTGIMVTSCLRAIANLATAVIDNRKAAYVEKSLKLLARKQLIQNSMFILGLALAAIFGVTIIVEWADLVIQGNWIIDVVLLCLFLTPVILATFPWQDAYYRNRFYEAKLREDRS